MDVTQQILFYCTFIWSIYLNYVNTESSPQKSVQQSFYSENSKSPLTDALQNYKVKRSLYVDEDAESIDKKAWNNNMRVWGKRQTTEKRPWSNNMRVWGKRDSILEEKRPWNNNMRVWGKRDNDDITEEKKAWNNNMRVWGKRNDDIIEEKKAWNNNMRVWGKRDDQHLDKKAWKGNMRVWGKRDSSPALNEDSLDNLLKKIKKSDTADLSAQKRWFTYPTLDFDHSGKRTWRTNTMRVWGK